MVNPILGTLVIAIGLAGALWPYKLAGFEEQMDSIGSKRSWSSVEPADWKVAVTRAMGVAVALFGLLIFFDI